MKKLLFVVSLLMSSAFALVGCGGNVYAQQPQSQQVSQINSALTGRYLFKSELHTVGAAQPFVEAGIINFDGSGRFMTFTTYNAGNGFTISPNSALAGSYSIQTNGFGTFSPDWLGGSFWMSPEHFFCVSSMDYCTVISSEPGRSWQGKLWKDKSTTTVANLSGSFIFESDGSLNQFAESGVISFSGPNTYMLASIYNVALHPESSNLSNPTFSICGVTTPMSYFGQPAIFEATQGPCPSTTGMDAFGIYCFLDGSFCLLVPDQTGAGWIAEMRRQ